MKNVYTIPDTLFKFPLQYNNTRISGAACTIAIPPDLYYRNTVSTRADTINGWGTVVTPYATFPNCLKYVSTVIQVDSVAVYGNPVISNDTTMYRDIKWFDPAQNYPVVMVRQRKTAGVYLTQTIEYADAKQYFQPAAFFAYYPLTPNMGDTITFQNLSTNAYNYKWYFGDRPGGAKDSSTEINTQHIFNILAPIL